MNTVSFVVDKLYQNNIIFDREQTKIKVRDNVFDKYYALCDEFNKFGYQVATNDINTIQDSDFVIYVDMPPKRPIKKDINKSFLILMESPLIKPANYDTT
ncbi:hypothetical protein KJ766_03575, partial [Patescibacteria group bacterium]|nr:hypothetical protein [Patescibacteria group bacterium]